jgi:uncharacterized membrane protein YoaT (DUF817 family)
MSVAESWQLVASNLASTPEILIILLVTGAGLVFYAEDFRIGLITHILIYGLTFVWFYTKNMTWSMPLIFMFVCIVLLTFTLMASQKAGEKGVII